MKRYLRWLWLNTRGVRCNMVARIVAGVAQAAMALLMVWLCRYFIDTAIGSGDRRLIGITIGELLAVVAVNIALRQVYYYMSVRATTFQANAIRLRIFGHLLRRRIYDAMPLHSGDVTSRLETDVAVISDAVADTLPQMVVTGARLLGAFLLLASMDRQLALLLLFATPLVVAGGKLCARKLRNMTLEVRKQDSRIQMLVQEGMEHNAMLRAMECGPWLTDRLESMQEGLFRKVERRTRFTLVTRTIMASCFSFGYLLAFVWGGLQLQAGVITVGVMTSFLQLVAQIQHPILDLLNMVPQVIHASASIDRLEELEGTEAEQEETTGRRMAGKLGVRVRNVKFRYAQGDRDILRNFSHDFRPGSRTALVGETGAGKTTLFRLMLALIAPLEGELTVYGEREQASCDARTRGNFVFVPQGNTLMSGTIRYNLRLANPEATEQEMRRALHVAAADFILERPEGLDTECGERGAGFSEGQAQRIAIARGLLRPGNILLLDEISASLDEETERELFRRLLDDYAEKTIIMITHRSAVAALCDTTVRVDRMR